MVRKLDKNLYFYKAKVVDVYDGDTCRVDIDLGFNTLLKNEKIRLYKINAPEVTGEQKENGKKSRDFLKELILNKTIFVETIKDKQEKYGRYLAIIWLENESGNIVNINHLLVENGFAEFKEY